LVELRARARGGSRERAQITSRPPEGEWRPSWARAGRQIIKSPATAGNGIAPNSPQGAICPDGKRHEPDRPRHGDSQWMVAVPRAESARAPWPAATERAVASSRRPPHHPPRWPRRNAVRPIFGFDRIAFAIRAQVANAPVQLAGHDRPTENANDRAVAWAGRRVYAPPFRGRPRDEALVGARSSRPPTPISPRWPSCGRRPISLCTLATPHPSRSRRSAGDVHARS